MKKIITLLLAALMVGSVFVGCGPAEKPVTTTSSGGASSGGVSSTGEIAKCVYAVPGDEPTDLTVVTGMINEKLKADNVGVELEFKYIPWDAWDQKINIMLSTGEKFDMFHIMNDRVSLSNYSSRGALTDITEIISKYGENITKLNPEIMMKSGQVGGKQFGIPAYWVESSYTSQITIRKDLMKKYGIEKTPTTWEELTAAYETVMSKWDGVQKPYLPLIGASSTGIGADAKAYDSWPYIIVDKMIYVNQDGTIKNYFETEEFKKSCNNANEWYKKGLINPDVLVFTNDQNTAQLNSGDWFVHFGTYGQAVSNLQTNYPDITVDDFEFIDLAPQKPNIRPYGTRNMQAIPASSENPEAGVKLVNWIYANQDNYDLFMYGREGTDYKKVGESNREDIVDPAKNLPLYNFADWMMGNVEYLRPAVGSPTMTNDLLYTNDKTAIESIVSTFTFDASNVQTQYTDVQTQIAAVISPMGCGIKDYDSNIENALSLLKKAGIDDIIAEYNKQFEASKTK